MMLGEPFQTGRVIAIMAVASLALTASLFMSWKPPDSSRSAESPGVRDGAERVEEKASDPARDVARAKTILRDIGGATRDERLQLWEELDGLRARSDQARSFLLHFARDEAGRADPYPRFVASATVAGFGRPSRMGPNSLVRGTSLVRYIELQRGTPVCGPRRLELDPALNGMIVEIEPNEKDDLTFILTFIEILWTILVKYKLSFRLDRTETFVISPSSPLA